MPCTTASPRPVPFAHLLGGEVWFKNALKGFGIHPFARIRNAQLEVGAGFEGRKQKFFPVAGTPPEMGSVFRFDRKAFVADPANLSPAGDDAVIFLANVSLIRLDAIRQSVFAFPGRRLWS